MDQDREAVEARRLVDDGRQRLEARLHPEVVAPGVIICLARDGAGWLKVLLEIGSEAMHEGVREAIPLALAWRDRVDEIQPRRSWRDQFLSRLWAEHKNGKSYAKLAAEVNLEVERALRLEHRAGPPAAGSARDIMVALGCKEEAIEDILTTRLPLEHLASDRWEDPPPLFSRDSPIWPEKVRSVLRKWERVLRHTARAQTHPRR